MYGCRKAKMRIKGFNYLWDKHLQTQRIDLVFKPGTPGGLPCYDTTAHPLLKSSP